MVIRVHELSLSGVRNLTQKSIVKIINILNITHIQGDKDL